MTVYLCKCGKMISVSVHPEGNPVAKADPVRWATKYGICENCDAIFCKDCLKSVDESNGTSICPQCDSKVKLQGV